MSFFKNRRNGSPDGAGQEGTDEPGGGNLPIARFDDLKGKDLTDKFRELTQAQLALLDEHEQSHGQRTDVLAKLRYMRTREPLPSYDDLDEGQIKSALVDADAETVKAVRAYERKFQRRTTVLAETARVLPGAEPSERERSAQEEKDARVRSKMRPR